MTYFYSILTAIGFAALVFLTVPWIIFIFERLKFNPLNYWDWCHRKQQEMRDKKMRNSA